MGLLPPAHPPRHMKKKRHGMLEERDIEVYSVPSLSDCHGRLECKVPVGTVSPLVSVHTRIDPWCSVGAFWADMPRSRRPERSFALEKSRREDEEH